MSLLRGRRRQPARSRCGFHRQPVLASCGKRKASSRFFRGESFTNWGKDMGRLLLSRLLPGCGRRHQGKGSLTGANRTGQSHPCRQSSCLPPPAAATSLRRRRRYHGDDNQWVKRRGRGGVPPSGGAPLSEEMPGSNTHAVVNCKSHHNLHLHSGNHSPAPRWCRTPWRQPDYLPAAWLFLPGC